MFLEKLIANFLLIVLFSSFGLIAFAQMAPQPPSTSTTSSTATPSATAPGQPAGITPNSSLPNQYGTLPRDPESIYPQPGPGYPGNHIDDVRNTTNQTEAQQLKARNDFYTSGNGTPWVYPNSNNTNNNLNNNPNNTVPNNNNNYIK